MLQGERYARADANEKSATPKNGDLTACVLARKGSGSFTRIPEYSVLHI